MTATTREEVLTDAALLDASTLEGAVLADAVAGLEPAGLETAGLEPAATTTPVAPAFSIVKGNPTDEDVAVLVTVLAAASSSAAPAGDGLPPETWGAPTRMHRGHAPFSPYSFGTPVAPRPF
ncbi:acyl-CoA carboxylase subunit epsilon [Prescottella sp. R16]|uniref:acyl-CoA carboxylase subunit epsilon n=1 Tax=Prescottella sp. R16 TaxID=3064529 RepID=UPI00272ED130|nr:acyl-CoA carboxylase subunit epsilon [Prescottella sp. R16]